MVLTIARTVSRSGSTPWATEARLAGLMPGLRLVHVIPAGLALFAAIAGALWLWWPLGVVVGLVPGVAVVLLVGRAMDRRAHAVPADGTAALVAGVDLPAEFRRLRVRLGEDWADFSRAAMHVTGAQWASTAGLQRELRITTAHAQHLMRLLEAEGFIGPPRGTRARIVRLPRERADDLRRLLHA